MAEERDDTGHIKKYRLNCNYDKDIIYCIGLTVQKWNCHHSVTSSSVRPHLMKNNVPFVRNIALAKQTI